MTKRDDTTEARLRAAIEELCAEADMAPVRAVAVSDLRDALNESASASIDRLPHTDVPGLTPETCTERATHGSPFRFCPVKGCGWHEGMDA